MILNDMSADTKKSIITIAGKPGSGKSTTSKRIASELGLAHYSSGDFFRAISKERGVDLLTANKEAETDTSIDERVDSMLRDLGDTQDNFVVDSRMAWHWMPYSFRVYLDLDLTVAAARILESLDDARLEHETIPTDVAGYAQDLETRLASESKRYQTLYRADPYNTANYDLVVDTAVNGPDAVITTITNAYQRWLLG
jgi:cytidylate kinase